MCLDNIEDGKTRDHMIATAQRLCHQIYQLISLQVRSHYRVMLFSKDSCDSVHTKFLLSHGNIVTYITQQLLLLIECVQHQESVNLLIFKPKSTS